MRQLAVVVGGGVVGLSLARELCRRSIEVDLLESRDCGSGASSAATGVLKAPPHTSSPFFQLRHQGWEQWPVLAAELEQETGIDVEYRRCGGIDIRDGTQRDPQRAIAALPQTGGEIRLLSAADLEQLLPTIRRSPGAGLFIENEARVDPRALIGALRQSCLQSGVRIHEQLGPIAVKPKGGDGIELVGNLPPELIQHHDLPVLLAAGWESAAALLDMPPSPLPLDPVRGEAIALDIPAPPHIVTFDARHDSIIDPAGNRSRFSWIPAPGGKSWLGNSVGAELDDSAPSCQPSRSGLEQLLDVAQSMFGESVRDAVIGHWAGIRPKAMRHGGPLLGQWPGRPQLWIATGHYRTGLLVGPVTARMVVEALLDATPIADSFSIPV